jgi:hypothetical protein
MSEIDILAGLQPYFSDSFTMNDEEKIDELFGVFQRDFFENPFQVQGKNVKVKIAPYTKHLFDGLPEFYCGYYEKFVHVITREIDGKLKISPKTRKFKLDRANRIHWIKPILEHANDKRITCFRFEENDGKIRDYYWYKQKGYMVVVEEVNPDYQLITGFVVDGKNVFYYNNKYNNRIV